MTASGARGTSLIELLVVIAVLAVLAAVALLSVNLGGAARHVERESRRLEALIEIACERAQLTGRPHGLHFARAMYGFSVQLPAGWRLETRGELRPRTLRAGLELAVARDDLALDLGRALADEPQSVCYPSGEMVDFRAEVRAADAAMVLEAGPDGRLSLAEAEVPRR
jgi:type II secretion system protein H